MSVQSFYLLGELPQSSKEIDVGSIHSVAELKGLIAAHFAIVEPRGMTVSPSLND